MGRGVNVPQVCVAGPTTKRLDEMIGDASQCRRCGRTNTEAVTGIIARDTRRLQDVAEPGVDQRWSEGGAIAA